MDEWEDRWTTLVVSLSYAKEDEALALALADELAKLAPYGVAPVHLAPAETTGSGAEPPDALVALVSPYYLAIRGRLGAEADQIHLAQRGGARVWPILARDCGWTRDPVLAATAFFAEARQFGPPGTEAFDQDAVELRAEIAQFLGAQLAATQPTVAEGVAESPGLMKRDLPREGLAKKGSRLQTQLYVNLAPCALNATVRAALPSSLTAPEIEWCSPLAADRYREYRDGAFLAAVGLSDLRGSLRDFWPASGPRWDALAVVKSSLPGTGVLLAEGKSYPGEMRSTTAARGRSRARIRDAIAVMQRRAGIPVDPDVWMNGHYQLANRLAHVYWLRASGVPAWLLQLLFSGDREHVTTSPKAWRDAGRSLSRRLGFEHLVGDSVVSVILPAIRRGGPNQS